MIIPKKLSRLMEEILEKDHSQEEWFALEKEVDEYFEILPQELRDYFADSGAGETLYMICSGIKYDKALRSYGVEVDEDGRYLSWGELDEWESLEEDPTTGEYRRKKR